MANTAQCAGFKRSGEPCTATVEPPQTYCWWHNPANAEQRSQAASKAARSKRQEDELAEAKRELKQVFNGVLLGKIPTGRASVAAQVAGVRLRYIEEERKRREMLEFEERLAALEAAQEQKGAYGWRA